MHFLPVSTVILTALFVPLCCRAAHAQDIDWQAYRSGRFGYSLLYPANLLAAPVESANGQGLEFVSGDGLVKLKVIAAPHSGDVTLTDYRAMILRDLPAGAEIKYGPMGQSWFVLSGFRDQSIYYEKVLFACGGHVINAFAMTYPQRQRQFYDPIVTVIEKNFHSTSGPACFGAVARR